MYRFFFTFLSLVNYSQVSPGQQGQPGIRSHFATLTVLVPPEAPRILLNGTDSDFMLTTEGKEIKLDCISIGGKPAATVRIIAKCDLSAQRLIRFFFFFTSFASIESNNMITMRFCHVLHTVDLV